MGPRNHVLDGGPDHPMGRGSLGRKGAPIVKYGDCLPWAVRAKMAEAIDVINLFLFLMKKLLYKHFYLFIFQHLLLELAETRCYLGCWVRFKEKPPTRWGPDLPVGKGNIEGDDILTWAVHNGRTDQDILWSGLRTRVGLRKHVLDGGPDHPCKGAILGKGNAGACPRHSAMSRELCKMAEPIEMPFGLWTGVGPRKCVVDGSRFPTQRCNF